MQPEAQATDPKEKSANSAMPAFSSVNWRDIVIVIGVAWMARLIFMWLMPPGARSFDAFSWEHQASLLNNGVNPYAANTLFNWPPFWMQCVFIISKISNFFGIPFFRVLQVFLVLFETAVIFVTIRVIHALAPAANVRALVIAGIALNPAAVLLICQHCNFDVIMALWVLLAVASLARYNASGNVIDWLSACLFLGLGILTKTVPLALVPLLAGGFRKSTASGKLLGAALVLGPVALGMSIIYVLSPAQIEHNVLGYRSQGYLEVILRSMNCDELSGCLRLPFYVLGIGIMVLTWRHLWTGHSLGSRELILYTALVLMAVAGEGAGFGGQYFYWYLPFLVISFACYGGAWRGLLGGFAVISAISFIISYGLFPAFGYNFLFLLSHAQTQEDLYNIVLASHDAFFLQVVNLSHKFDQPGFQALEGIPLYIGGIVLLAFGTHILFNNVKDLPKKWVLGLVGFYVLSVIAIFGTAIAVKDIDSGRTGAHDSSLIPNKS